MKQISVKYRPDFLESDFDQWSCIDENSIDIVNWAEYSYRPQVSFKVLHDGCRLYIKYEVVEDFDVRAVEAIDQGRVYQDSCVEFFITDAAGDYHNFEFNSKGVCLSAYGPFRHDRTPRNYDELKRIIRVPSGVSIAGKGNRWTLLIGIPFDVLKLQRKKYYRANFYKCGDKTQQTHYLSWNKILTEQPDFHRPEFFGQLLLE